MMNTVSNFTCDDAIGTIVSLKEIESLSDLLLSLTDCSAFQRDLIIAVRACARASFKHGFVAYDSDGKMVQHYED